MCLKRSNGSKDKSLPIMYWIQILHRNPVCSRFIIASKNCSTKPLSKAVFNIIFLDSTKLIIVWEKIIFFN